METGVIRMNGTEKLVENGFENGFEKLVRQYISELAELEKRVVSCREQRKIKSCFDCNVACSGGVLKEVVEKLNEMKFVIGLKILNI
jgi:aldehyde:ferredoxin oxidoreductase